MVRRSRVSCRHILSFLCLPPPHPHPHPHIFMWAFPFIFSFKLSTISITAAPIFSPLIFICAKPQFVKQKQFYNMRFGLIIAHVSICADVTQEEHQKSPAGTHQRPISSAPCSSQWQAGGSPPAQHEGNSPTQLLHCQQLVLIAILPLQNSWSRSKRNHTESRGFRSCRRPLQLLPPP